MSSRHFSWWRAALIVVVPLVTLSVAQSAQADLDYVVTLKDGSTYQGALVEYAPNDHVTLHLATGETKRFAWTQIALPSLPPAAAPPLPPPPAPAEPPAEAAPPPPEPLPNAITKTQLELNLAILKSQEGVTPDSTTSSSDGVTGPRAGTWSVDMRIPFGFTFSQPNPSLQGWGFDLDVGTRLGDRVYLGALGGVSQVWDLGGGEPLLFAKTRVGGDLDVIVHQATNEEDPARGHYQWIGIRGGAEGVRSITPTGAFVELDYGMGSWAGSSTFGQLGTVFGAGLSFEPPGIYGSSAPDPGNPSAVSPSPSGRTISPYLTAAFHFGLGG